MPSSTSIWACSVEILQSIPFDQLLIQTINGIVTGMILALVASGLTLIFGIMDVVNFAHGELFMLGAYVGVVVLAATGDFWVALVVASLVIALLGAVIYLVTLRARAIDAESFLASAYDPYVFLRDAYRQQRLYQLYDGNPPNDVIEQMQGSNDKNFDPDELLKEQHEWERKNDTNDKPSNN